MTYTKLTDSGRKCQPLKIEDNTIDGVPVVSVLVNIIRETAFVESYNWERKIDAVRSRLSKDLDLLIELSDNLQVHNIWTKSFVYGKDVLVLRLVERTMNSKDGYFLGFALLGSYGTDTYLYEPYMGVNNNEFHQTINYMFKEIKKKYQGR